MSKLDTDIKTITRHLVEKQGEFDSVMDLVRNTIRNSAHAITMLHNNDKKGAEKAIAAAKKMMEELHKFPSFEYQSKQAYQEYAEAFIFFRIKQYDEIPIYSSVGIDHESYLMGLMDVIGELKREILESLRENNADDAEEYFKHMCNIYDSTRSIRFAEAVLNGFRKKQDVARIQLESAGSEILSFKRR